MGEKFLEVVNTWMNLKVPELFSRQKNDDRSSFVS